MTPCMYFSTKCEGYTTMHARSHIQVKVTIWDIVESWSRWDQGLAVWILDVCVSCLSSVAKLLNQIKQRLKPLLKDQTFSSARTAWLLKCFIHKMFDKNIWSDSDSELELNSYFHWLCNLWKQATFCGAPTGCFSWRQPIVALQKVVCFRRLLTLEVAFVQGVSPSEENLHPTNHTRLNKYGALLQQSVNWL